MSLSQHIHDSFQMPSWLVERFLEDLSDADLMVRPAPSMNHIAWQLGHLISGEQSHFDAIRPDSMPPLPEGFAAKHTKQTAGSDNPADFETKERYLQLMRQQRAATLELLAMLSDEDLMAPPPEKLRYFGPTVGCVFAGEAGHWMLHAGQWSVVRRGLGRPPLF